MPNLPPNRALQLTGPSWAFSGGVASGNGIGCPGGAFPRAGS